MRYILIITLGITMLALWGCQKSTSPVENENDEEVIKDLIAEIESDDNEDYFYSSLNDESEDSFFDQPENGFAKPIVPVRFGRIGLRPIVRDVRVVRTSDTTATALFSKILRGHFVVVTLDSEFVVRRIVRPMGHSFQRVAHFAKRGNSNMRLRDRWKLVDFSMVDGKSLGIVDTNLVRTTLNIVKMEVEGDSLVEITDPLEYFQTKKNLFTFEQGTDVTVTVYVENSSPEAFEVPQGAGTEFVRLHFARHRRLRHHGVRYLQWIRKDGNVNVYQGSWTIGPRLRIHHAAIDVIDNGVIFDDDTSKYPYNSVTWSTPYRIKPLN